MTDTWTDDRITRLKELVAEGQSYTDIARTLSVMFPFNTLTRNAALGKAHRLRIHTTRAIPIRKARRTPRFKEARYFAPKRPRHMTRVEKALAKLQVEPMPLARAEDVARVSFTDLREHHCKWPVGDPVDAGNNSPIFCGAERVPGLPYCPEHTRRAYGSAAPEQRSTAMCAKEEVPA